MLNMTNIIRRIKFKLGIVNMALPFDNINQLIQQIIEEFTVPTFSLYCPDRKIMRVNVKESFEVVDRQTTYTEFLIPDTKNFKVLYVNDVYYNEDQLTNLGYYAGMVPMGLYDVPFVNQMMLNNLSAQIINKAVPKMTFRWMPPRRLQLYNCYWSNVMMFDWSFEHSRSLNTIPDDALNAFMDLALLDVKENLYPTLAQYVEQNTQYGSIRLPIDNWANAEQERKELLNQWDDVYHLDGIPFWFG